MDPSPGLLALLVPCLAEPSRFAVLLDLDGTLAPIVPRPSDVRLLDGMRETLLDVRSAVGLLGFVSGRRLAELERIVGLDGCAYAGNHGMEIHRRGEAARLAAPARAHLRRLEALVDAFPPDVLAPAGVWLEDKGPTLTFHYRTAPEPEVAVDLLTSKVVPAAEGLGLVTAPGRMSLEVRPPVALDKGTATRELLAGTGIRFAMSVGDDRTDAHAWDAVHGLRSEGGLSGAVAVAVRNSEVPAEILARADAQVQGIDGVRDLLRHVATHAGSPARSRASSANG